MRREREYIVDVGRRAENELFRRAGFDGGVGACYHIGVSPYLRVRLVERYAARVGERGLEVAADYRAGRDARAEGRAARGDRDRRHGAAVVVGRGGEQERVGGRAVP
ncbi:hypothetical protein SDC9_175183 [bioreactor metagenome]|uniref:Uncharacterized protein n=1 Tax=bioreactor metagenome TaxID=1076179 RepID=A0A645GPC4_9ZZZZ